MAPAPRHPCSMKKEARILSSRALDSLLLAVEHFNRPWDRGRVETVLILLDRGFELLLKAVIVHRNGRIRESREPQTIGFDKCVRKCLSEGPVRCLTEEQALTLQILNSLRDAAQHYYLEVPEQQLYLYTQTGVTLFEDLLRSVFGKSLSEYLPERILPVSTAPPRDLESLMRFGFSSIKVLLRPGSRKMMDARAKLRALAIVESSVYGQTTQPSEAELNRLLRRVREATHWEEVFPGVASLSLETSGNGIRVSIRLTKKDGDAVHLVPDDTPGAAVAIRRVNELGFYTLGLREVAGKVGLSMPRTLALIRHLRLQDSPEHYKELRIGSALFKRYSQNVLPVLREARDSTDLDEVWEKHGPRARVKKPRR